MAPRVCTLVLSSLPFVDTPFNTLYSHAGRFCSKQIYEQEMKLGHLVLDLDKLLLFGTAGSGKTCSLAALLGVDPPTIRRSTPLMKRPIEVVFIDVDAKKNGGRFEQSVNCKTKSLKSSGHEYPVNRQCHRAVVAQPPPTSSLPTPHYKTNMKVCFYIH